MLINDFYNIFQIKVLQAKNTSDLNTSITDALETILKSIWNFSPTQWMHKQIDRQTYWCQAFSNMWENIQHDI